MARFNRVPPVIETVAIHYDPATDKGTIELQGWRIINGEAVKAAVLDVYNDVSTTPIDIATQVTRFLVVT